MESSTTKAAKVTKKYNSLTTKGHEGRKGTQRERRSEEDEAECAIGTFLLLDGIHESGLPIGTFDSFAAFEPFAVKLYFAAFMPSR